MKKIFILNLLAIVTITWTTAQYYSLGSVDQDINCNGEIFECAAQYGCNIGYSAPADSAGNPGNQILFPVMLIGQFFDP